MEVLTKVRKAALGLSLLTLAFGIACGKKGGGGVVTPPVTGDGDCLGDSDCDYGQNYTHGDFLAKAIGKAKYGNNRTVTLKLAFFAKDDVDGDDDNYEGDVVATGGLYVREGDDYANIGNGVLLLSERRIAGIDWQIDFGVNLNLGNNNQDNYWHDDVYVEPIIWLPPQGCYHNQGCHKNCQASCNHNYRPRPQPCYEARCGYGCNENNSCDGYDSDCRLPKGDYSVKTVEDTKGQWSRYNKRYAYVSGLKLVIKSGDKESRATFNGYVDNSDDNKDGKYYKLTGRLTLTKVNGKTCSTRVQFN